MAFACAERFGYSPAPITSPYDYRVQTSSGIDLPALMQRTQELNVPFSSEAYNNARACCPFPPGLPRWPAKKMYPVRDDTPDFYDVHQPRVQDDVNTYRDVLTNHASDGTWVPDPATLIASQATSIQPQFPNANVVADVIHRPLKPAVPAKRKTRIAQAKPKPKVNVPVLATSVGGGLAVFAAFGVLAFVL